MFPKENRLSGKKAFNKVKEEGRLYQSTNLALLFRKREYEGPVKIGIIVSNKISGKATERNRVKRALRTSLAPLLSKIMTNYDLIFLAKKRIIGEERTDLSREINNMLRKLGLLK